MHAEVGLIKTIIANIQAAVAYVRRAAERLPKVDWRVLRDSPVRFAMARSESLSRTCMRLIFPKISMAITLFAPA